MTLQGHILQSHQDIFRIILFGTKPENEPQKYGLNNLRHVFISVKMSSAGNKASQFNTLELVWAEQSLNTRISTTGIKKISIIIINLLND